MDFVFLFRLISYIAFFIFQIILIFFAQKALKLKGLAESEKKLLTGVLVLFISLIITGI